MYILTLVLKYVSEGKGMECMGFMWQGIGSAGLQGWPL